MLKRRSTATRSPIQLRVEQPPDGGEASEDDNNEPSRRLRQATNEVIDTAATADRLVSNLDDGDDNADDDTTGHDSELSAFIAATDFESETLYLETRQIEQCYRLSLCFVSWQETEIHTSYDRQLRPYDAQCTADREVTEARLIRLPVALSSDSINSIGTSIGSARCRQVVETRVNDSATDSGMTSDTGVSSGGSA